MKPGPAPALPRQPSDSQSTLLRLLLVFILLYFFLLGVNGLGAGFKSLGSGLLERFFTTTTNPFLGLIVGLLATTLVQSSSVTTSLIVGLVAAPVNPLPLANAVPMVMGANIGTTVTNTLVSMAHVTRKDEFRRAFAVATCHDFFNFISVAILLPLEMTTGYLRHLAELVAVRVNSVGGADFDSPIKVGIEAGSDVVKSVIAVFTGDAQAQGIALIVVSAVMIYAALLLLVRTMRSLVQKRVEGAVSGVFNRNPVIAILVGVIVTVLVQSSSITTSLLVPLAGAGVITLVQAFPVTIGANLGTTVTALLASMAVTGPNAVYGVTIALVHLFFNLSGTVLIFPIARIRQVPLSCAQGLADTAVHSRWWALAYVSVLFYALPAVLAYMTHVF